MNQSNYILCKSIYGGFLLQRKPLWRHDSCIRRLWFVNSDTSTVVPLSPLLESGPAINIQEDTLSQGYTILLENIVFP